MFDEDIDDFFDAAEHGTAAVYRTAANVERSVVVIMGRPDVTVDLGTFGATSPGNTALIARASLESEPKEGDELQVGAFCYRVDKAVGDPTRRVFTLDLIAA